MEAVDRVKECLGHPYRSKWMPEWDEVAVFSQQINHDQHTVVVIREGKTFSEIKGYHLPSRLWNR